MPPVGYEDFHRRIEQTSRLVVNVQDVLITAQNIQGRFYVGEFTTLFVRWAADFQPELMDTTWFESPTGGLSTEGNEYFLDAGKRVQFGTPVIAPYVSFSFFQILGQVNGTYDLSVYASNAGGPHHALAGRDACVYSGSTTVAADGVSTTDLEPYWGEAHMSWATTSTNFEIELTGQDHAGQFSRRLWVTKDPEPATGSAVIWLPPWRNRLVMKNFEAAARNFNASVVPAFI